MKKLTFSTILLLLTNLLISQNYKADFSSLFIDNIGEPVLLMKNGSTVFQYSDEDKQKMFITIFDNSRKVSLNRKEIAFKEVKYVYHPTVDKSSNIISWNDEKGKIIIYINSKKVPYKVIIDSKTGNIESESIIENFNLPKGLECIEEKGGDGYKVKYICAEKLEKELIDHKTGNYLQTNRTRIQLSGAQATARTNFDDIQTVEPKIINSFDKEIQKIEFNYMNKKYNNVSKRIEYFDNDKIYYLWRFTKMIDRASYDGAGGTFYFSIYDIKTKIFSHIELIDIKEQSYAGCLLYRNFDNSRFIVKFIAKTGYQNEQAIYDVFFVSIDPTTLKAEPSFRVSGEKLEEYVKTNCKIKDGYGAGMMDQFLIDAKGNFLVTKVKNVFSTSDLTKDFIYSKNPELIGISCIDKSGKEINGWAYPYNNNGTPYIASQTQNDFDYFIASSSKNNYVFLNDLSKNFGLTPDQKPDYAGSTEECNAMAIELLPNGEIKKEYLFGNSESKSTNKYGDFKHALYDEGTNTIILRVYEGPGFKTCHAAWIKME